MWLRLVYEAIGEPVSEKVEVKETEMGKVIRVYSEVDRQDGIPIFVLLLGEDGERI